MTEENHIKLDNYEDEDIFEVIVKLEKSFAIKFNKTAFNNSKTFGDICDVIHSHINYAHCEGCTTQQAFYKIRKAISNTLLIDEKQIKPDSNLADLLPGQNRRRQIKKFQNYLGFKIDILTYPDWLTPTFEIGFFLSIIAFFFDWRIAISGLIFFVLCLEIARNFGKKLKLQTVRQLTKKNVIEHYIEVRTMKGTVNRNEILETIIHTFSTDLGINKEHLTRDAKLNWA